MKIKHMLMVLGCAVLLCGCTKSNIVQPDLEPGETMGPDFDLYSNIEIDGEQLQEDVEDIFLDEKEYPMASAIDIDLNLDEEYLAVTVIVKDGTSAEDAAAYAEAVIKGTNDQIAVQDFGYAESDDDSYGGIHQDNEIRVTIYDESSYESDGEPMYEATFEKDVYQPIIIE